MGFSMTLMVCGLAFLPGQDFASGFHHDFRGDKGMPAELVSIGSPADGVIRRGNDGIRITIEPNLKPTLPVGFRTNFPIHGDFEILLAFEILETPPPATGSGIGLELYLVTDTPTQEAVGFYRLLRTNGAEIFQCTRMTGQAPNRRYLSQRLPATSKSGRMRLTRTGTEVTFWVAEVDGADFQPLHRDHLGAEDVLSLRVAASSGRTPHAVDLLIKELTVRSLALPGLAGDAASSAPASGWKPWLALALVLLLAVGIRQSVRGSRRAARLAESAISTEPAAIEAASPSLVFPCSRCGKNLKVRARLAGKKAKCPGCGQTMGVPEK